MNLNNKFLIIIFNTKEKLFCISFVILILLYFLPQLGNNLLPTQQSQPVHLMVNGGVPTILNAAHVTGLLSGRQFPEGSGNEFTSAIEDGIG